MDLVALGGDPVHDPATLAYDLLRGEPGSGREEREAGHLWLGRFDPVLDHLAEHLVAAADPEERAASGQRRSEGAFEAACAHPREVCHRRLGPRQHDEVGVPELARPLDVADADPGLEGECVEVGEVRQPGQANHCDVELVAEGRSHRPGTRTPEREGVLRVERDILDPGHHAETRQAAPALQLLDSRTEE